jgi:uncharacterized membrane protein YoaK (UPF0700 family)
MAIFGVFTAHVTGNFVVIGAALGGTSSGLLTKLMALPVFVVSVALVTAATRKRVLAGSPPRRGLLVAQTAFLAATTVSAVMLGPFDHPDSPESMLVAMLAVVAMAVQNASSRLVFSTLAPTTVMTGNVTQLVIDLVELALASPGPAKAEIAARIRKFWPPIAAFATGAIGGALVYAGCGFLALLLPIAALVVACVRAREAPLALSA